MTKTLFAAVTFVLLSVCVASAQSRVVAMPNQFTLTAPDPTPDFPYPVSGKEAFEIESHIDWSLDLFNGTSLVNNIVTAGWQFECRSGLQVTTQRLGVFGILFTNLTDPTDVYAPPVNNILTIVRPDVAAAYATQCPGVGVFVGFGIFSSPPPHAGTWQVHVVWRTSDGAGRPVQTDSFSTVTVGEHLNIR